MIRNLLLDLDDTLLDFGRSESESFSQMLREMGLTPTEEITTLYSRINRDQWKMLERGETTREALRLDRFRILFEEMGVSLDPQKAADTYCGFLGKSCYLLPGAIETVRDLKKTCRVYLASNGFREIQLGRIAASGLDKMADGIFVSQDIGSDKPETEYFEACFSKIPDFRREETAIAGDSLSSDILGGNRAGIKTIWLNPSGKVPGRGGRPDYIIKRITELPALLAKI